MVAFGYMCCLAASMTVSNYRSFEACELVNWNQWKLGPNWESTVLLWAWMQQIAWVEDARGWALSRSMGGRQPSSLCHCRVGAKPPGEWSRSYIWIPCFWIAQDVKPLVIWPLKYLIKGDVGEAKKMISAAAEAGADCVKFQKSCLKVNSWKPCILSNNKHLFIPVSKNETICKQTNHRYALKLTWLDWPQEKFNGAALARSYSGPNSWGSTYGEHKQHLVCVVGL